MWRLRGRKRLGCARLTAAAAAGLGGDEVGDEHRCRAGQRKSGAAKSWYASRWMAGGAEP